MQNSCGLHWTRQHSENTQGRPQQPCGTTGAKCKTSRDGRTIPSLCWLSTGFPFNTDSNYWELVSSGLGLWDRQVSLKSTAREGLQVKGAPDLELTSAGLLKEEGSMIKYKSLSCSALLNIQALHINLPIFSQADISTPCSYFWLCNFASCIPHV